jgi:hypothetical protein
MAEDFLYNLVLLTFNKGNNPHLLTTIQTFHPDLSLAQLLQAINRLEEAEPMFQRAIEIAKNSWGKEHPSTKTIEENYSLFKKQIPPSKDSE